MALDSKQRKLLHQKGQKPITGKGNPNKADGKDGDIAYKDIQGQGTVHFVKAKGEWKPLSSSGAMPSSRTIIGGTSRRTISGVSAHDGLTGLGDDDHTQYLLTDGTRPMTSDITIGNDLFFSSSGAVINWDTDDLTLTHSANTLTLAGGTFAAAAITGTTIDASTDFTIDGLILTADNITNDNGLEIQTTGGNIVLDPGGNEVLPGSDDADDLGASGTQWKDLYIDGVAYIDTLNADALGANLDHANFNSTNVDIDSGAIDGTTIGVDLHTTIKGTTIDATTDFTVGDTIITDGFITDSTGLGITANVIVTGNVAVGYDGSGHDVKFNSGTAGDSFFWDSSEEKLVITGTSGQVALDVADGDVKVVDKLYLYDTGGEYLEGDGSDLTLNAGTAINIKANNIDIGKDANADIVLRFLTSNLSGDGYLRWMEDEDYFKFSDDLLIEGNEKLYLNSTSAWLYSEDGGYIGVYPKIHIAPTGTSQYVTNYAVNIEPQTSGRHLTSGEADYKENYSWLSLYLLQSDVTTFDSNFGEW